MGDRGARTNQRENRHVISSAARGAVGVAEFSKSFVVVVVGNVLVLEMERGTRA